MAEPGSKRLGSARGRKQEEMEEDLQKLADGIIGEEYIQKETGTEDMASIVHLALTIDTTRQSIYELNEFLPNLKHLVLDNSNISSVRDLGIGLRSLTSLSLSCCGLNDIDGIGVLTGLQELCLSDNYITDVTPLAMHENLQSLNLSGNKIGDWSIADALSSSLQLRALFLARNPLCRARNYRLILASLVPGIEMLDGSPVDAAAAKRVTNGMILESAAELRMAEEDADDELRLESEIVGEPDHYPKPKVASNSFDGMPDTGSELTHGTGHVLAGNMAAAVRRRRQLLSSTDSLNSQDNAPGPTRQSREYESTLDILDAALLPCARTEPLIGAIVGPSTSNPFQKEGDVTSALMGNAAMYAQRADKQRDKDRERDNSGSSAGLRVERGDSGDSLSLRPSGSASPLVGARKERELRDSKDSKDSKERDGKDRDSKDRDSREREREHPSASLQSSHQFRPRSAATSSLKRLGSAGAMGTVPGSGSRDEDWVSRNSSFQSDSGSGGVGQSHSPRQRNASRPQSATSVLSDPQSPRHADAYAAPFKVVVQRDVDSPGRPSADVDEVGSPRRGSGKVAPSPGRAGWRDGREDRECLKDINPIKDGIASSIVHLDIVRRANSARDEEGEVVSDKDKGDDDSTDSSDTEDIAVTHAARHRLMSASASAAAANSATSTLKTRQHILQQLKNTSAPSSSTPSSAPSAALSALPDEESCAEEGIASVIGRQPGGMGSARFSGLDEGSPHRPPISRTLLKDTLSSQAGISLGFNLAGSLAAIDKWVQDMNSEDEEDSDPVGAGAVGAGDADGYTSRSDRDRDFEVSGASALEAGAGAWPRTRRRGRRTR
ncbi:hypothetical protein B484DRAFT_238724 [Ochromonadaceae sp. CCMP2298]|nr:hypothetical protein B484DRAFT_238724 [Ochromonadaceae sp. CCMP2298]